MFDFEKIITSLSKRNQWVSFKQIYEQLIPLQPERFRYVMTHFIKQNHSNFKYYFNYDLSLNEDVIKYSAKFNGRNYYYVKINKVK